MLIFGGGELRPKREAGVAVAAEEAHTLRDPVLGRFPGHPAGQVHKQELIVFDIELRRRGKRDLRRQGGGKQFTL
jgi:hypothetical protein